MSMSPEAIRRFAKRCRQLMLRVRTEAARHQLQMWADEFENYAEAVELERQHRDREPEQ
jgi:hypothetical protein